MVFANHGDGRPDLWNWYAGDVRTLAPAHELGHALGLRDEYLDGRSPDRGPGGPGIYEDHSIMGDFYFERERLAAPRLRHGQTIADEVGAATTRRFTATEIPPPTPVVAPTPAPGPAPATGPAPVPTPVQTPVTENAITPR